MHIQHTQIRVPHISLKAAGMLTIALSTQALLAQDLSAQTPPIHSIQSQIDQAETVFQLAKASGQASVHAVRAYQVPTDTQMSFHIAVPLPDGAGEIEVQFAQSSIRGDGFRVYTREPNGQLVEIDPGPIRTMVATVKETGHVIGTGFLAEDGLEAHLTILDTLYKIEPSKRSIQLAHPSMHSIGLVPASGLEANTKFCGNVDQDFQEHSQQTTQSDHDLTTSSIALTLSPGEYVVELACEVDSYFDSQYPIFSASSGVESIVNSISSLYAPSAIDVGYYITSIVVNTAQGDPYGLPIQDSQGFLNSFQNQITNSTIPDDHPYDAALMFSGRSLTFGGSGTVFGQAQIAGDAMCSVDSAGIPNLAYAFMTYRGVDLNTPDSNFMNVLGAHELGHLWGMQHHLASGCSNSGAARSIMCAGEPDGGSNQFNAANIAELVSNRNGAECIDYVPFAANACTASGEDSWDNDINFDYNRNYVWDRCELDDPYVYNYPSPDMGPFHGNQPQSTVIFGLPMATSDVTIRMEAENSDLGANNETVELKLNGIVLDVFFANESGGCKDYDDTLTIPMASFNAALSNIDQTAPFDRDIFELTATSAVDDGCSTGTFINFNLDYSTRNRDADQNGLLDEYEIVVLGLDDCNGNRSLDGHSAEIDCNGNGVPDDCDLDPMDPDGDGFIAADCNTNGLLDSCELASPMRLSSPDLVPPFGTDTAVHTFENLLPAQPGTVSVELHALARLYDDDQFYEVYLNGAYIGNYFDYRTASSTGCFDRSQSIALSYDEFNSMLVGGDLTVEVVPNGISGAQCGSSTYLRTEIAYMTAVDLDGMGDIDACQIATAPAPGLDLNGNQILDFLEPDCDSDGIPNNLESKTDSDGDGTPDSCELTGYAFNQSFQRFSPIDDRLTYTIVIPLAPLALSDVILDFVGIGDFELSYFDFDIVLGPQGSTIDTGEDAFDVSTSNAPECGEFYTDSETIDSSDFNDAIASDGSITITLTPNGNIDMFSDNCPIGVASYIDMSVSYLTVPEGDCNENGIPDSWDIASGSSLDTDGDRIPDECQPFRPDTVTRIAGTIQSGQLTDVIGSDDARVEIRGAKITLPSTQVLSRSSIEITGTPLVSSGLTSYSFSFEGFESTFSGITNYTVEVYNYASDEYELFMSGPVANTSDLIFPAPGDTIVTLSNLDNYVDSLNNQVRARISLESLPRAGSSGGPLSTRNSLNSRGFIPLPRVPIIEFHIDDVNWIVY